MARRTRTAKSLAQRIDLNYFKRMTPLRRWRFGLCVALPAAALLWLTVMGAAGKEEIYVAGPVSSAHAFIGESCQSCHVRERGRFLRKIQDEACLACHDGPVHNEAQVFTPSCDSCHREHQGPVRLARVRDAGCAQCHASLQVAQGELRFAARVTGFNRDHPEFAILRNGAADPAALSFNHASHMKEKLRAPMGEVTLSCADCHRPAGQEGEWRFAREGHVVPGAARDPRQRPRAARMQPIRYLTHCAQCHLLDFDPDVPGQVPHEEPAKVRAFLQQTFREYIAAHPAELRRAGRRDIRVPSQAFAAAPPRSADAWVAGRMRDAERLLWQKTCKQCHVLEVVAANGLARIQPPEVPSRWFQHAEFTHQPHQMLDCTSCHAGVLQSSATRDVLLPGIETCQSCHAPDRGAESGCFACHGYHDWSKQKVVPGRYTIPQLRRGG